MRVWKLAAVAALLVVGLSGCGQKLPEVADEATIVTQLPEELTQVSINGTAQPSEVTELTILERSTDLTKQTDDVTCALELEGDRFQVSLDCVLHYAYVRETGWTIRDYELTDIPDITLDSASWLSGFEESNISTLESEGYTNITLQDTLWDSARNGYTQVFAAESRGTYLTTATDVTVNGSLQSAGRALSYQWTRTTQASDPTQTIRLTGTVWHLLQEDEELEVLFRVTGVEENTLSLEGLVRRKNSLGRVREYELKQTTAECTVTEYGSIVFELTPGYGDALTFHIQEDAQWAEREGLYLGRLTAESLLDATNLSDLMELELGPSIWELPAQPTEPTESTQPAQPSQPVQPETPEPEQDDKDRSSYEDWGNDLADRWSDAWQSVQDFWHSLW